PPATTGPLKPSPTVFSQTTGGPLSGHDLTRPVSAETPSRLGPSHCGQSAAKRSTNDTKRHEERPSSRASACRSRMIASSGLPSCPSWIRLPCEPSPSIYNVASGTGTSSCTNPGAADGSAYKGIDVTQFRSFRNTDPPGLVEV